MFVERLGRSERFCITNGRESHPVVGHSYPLTSYLFARNRSNLCLASSSSSATSDCALSPVLGGTVSLTALRILAQRPTSSLCESACHIGIRQTECVSHRPTSGLQTSFRSEAGAKGR